MKSTKKSLVFSTLSLLICISMLLGTTFAWFTDSVTSGVNKIVAGNLDVEVEYLKKGTDGAPLEASNDANWASMQDATSLFSSSLWEPGHTEYVTLKVVNKGTLAFKYKINVSPISETGGINMSGASFKLSDYLVFATTAASNELKIYDDRAAARDAAGTAQTLNQANLSQSGTLYPTSEKSATQPDAQYITLVVYMPETVGNEANYKTGTTPPEIDLGITVIATQKDYEKDSFDDTYDKDVDFDPASNVLLYNYFPQIITTAQITKTSTDVTSKDSFVEKQSDNSLLIKSDVQKKEITKIETDTNELASVVIPKGVIEALSEGDHEIVLSASQDNSANANFKAESTAPDMTDKESVTYEISLTQDGEKVTSANNTGNYLYKTNIFIGENRQNLDFYHRNVKMTKVENENALKTADQFVYNSTTGYITMLVNGYSPFTAVYDQPIACIDTAVYYELSAAFDAVKSSEDVIHLLDDIALSAEVIIEKEINLNLNGYSIDADTYSIKVSNGKLNVGGMGQITGTPSNYKLIYLVGSTSNAATHYADLTIGEDVIVNCTNGYAIMVSANSEKAYGVNINVNGEVEGYYGALYINGSIKATDGNVPTVNVNETAVLKAADDAAAIYAAGYGVWNLKGSVTGGSAVYAKSGKLTITEGSYTATGAKIAYSYQSSGYEATGDAIVVENCNYPGGAPVVSITGGSFESKNALAVASYVGNGATEKVSNFVTGGSFSSDPKDCYDASVYHTLGKGPYTVDKHVLGDCVDNKDGTHVQKCSICKVDMIKAAHEISRIEHKEGHVFSNFCECGYTEEKTLEKTGTIKLNYGNSQSIKIDDTNSASFTFTGTDFDGKLSFDSDTNTIKLLSDVSVGQLDLTADENSGEGAMILDLNGFVLENNSWSGFDIHPGYFLMITDSNPEAEHKGAIMAYYEDLMWDYEGRPARYSDNYTKVTDYTIKGGIITNVLANKPGEPLDGNGISTEENVTLVMNGGTIAGIYGQSDIAGICMDRGFKGSSKLYLLDNAGIVGCTAAAGAVEIRGNTQMYMDDNAHISYCSAGNNNYSGGGVVIYGSSVFTMNGGSIDHCTSPYGGEGAAIYVDGGNGTDAFIMNAGVIDNCVGNSVIWGQHGNIVFNGGTIKNSESKANGIIHMQGSFDTNYVFKCTVNNLTMVNNACTGSCGIFDVNDNELYVNNCDISENTCAKTWLFCCNDGKLEIKGGTFANNIVNGRNSDGRMIRENNNNLKVEGGTFTNNKNSNGVLIPIAQSGTGYIKEGITNK